MMPFGEFAGRGSDHEEGFEQTPTAQYCYGIHGPSHLILIPDISIYVLPFQWGYSEQIVGDDIIDIDFQGALPPPDLLFTFTTCCVERALWEQLRVGS